MGLGIKIPRNALAKAAKEFKDNPNGENVELEAGTYLAVIKGLKGVETQKGPQVIAECVVGGDVDEKVKGGKVALWFSFDEDRVIHLLRFLAKLGYDVDELDVARLEEIADEMKEANHVIRLKASASKDGEHMNVRMDKVMTDMTADEVMGGASASDDTEAEEEEAKPKKKAKKEVEAEEEVEEEEKPTKSVKKKAKPEPEEEEAEEEEEKPAKKAKKEVVEEEEEEEVAEEENTVVKVGLKVKFKIKGEQHKGSIVSIDHEEGKVVVLSAVDKKKYRLSPDKLEN